MDLDTAHGERKETRHCSTGAWSDPIIIRRCAIQARLSGLSAASAQQVRAHRLPWPPGAVQGYPIRGRLGPSSPGALVHPAAHTVRTFDHGGLTRLDVVVEAMVLGSVIDGVAAIELVSGTAGRPHSAFVMPLPSSATALRRWIAPVQHWLRAAMAPCGNVIGRLGGRAAIHRACSTPRAGRASRVAVPVSTIRRYRTPAGRCLMVLLRQLRPVGHRSVKKPSRRC